MYPLVHIIIIYSTSSENVTRWSQTRAVKPIKEAYLGRRWATRRSFRPLMCTYVCKHANWSQRQKFGDGRMIPNAPDTLVINYMWKHILLCNLSQDVPCTRSHLVRTWHPSMTVTEIVRVRRVLRPFSSVTNRRQVCIYFAFRLVTAYSPRHR